MIRFISTSALLLASAGAVQVNALETHPGEHYENSRHCQRGPQGLPGTTGQDGATGPTGPAGPAADPVPPGKGAYVGFGNGNFIVPLGFSVPDGVSVISTCAASGDFPIVIGPGGPELSQNLFVEFSFNTPTARVISSIGATFTFDDDLTAHLPPTDITIRAEIWVAPFGSQVFSPSGAGVDFAPINTSAILANTTIYAPPTLLNVPVAAGSRLLMVFSRTSNPSSPPITIFGGCSAGIHL